MKELTGDSNAIALNKPGVLEALNAREHDAIKLLYFAYAKRLFKYAYSRTKDQAESEDIVNKCFVIFFEHKGTFDHLLQIGRFLYTTAEQLSLRFLRDSIRRSTIEKDVFGTAGDEKGYVENEVLHGEITDFINQLILQLTEKQRNVFNLLIREGKTAAEVAAELGITVGDVYLSKYRALVFLKTHLAYNQAITWLLPLFWSFRKLF